MTKDDQAEQRRFRDALGTFATGVTVVSTRALADGEDRVHGMTANGFMSVSLDPALVVVSIASSARMCALLDASGRYGVSVLSREQETVSRHFAGRPAEREITLTEVDGMPLVAEAMTHVVAEIVDAHPAGDHTLFVGRVSHFAHRPGEPLIFHSGAYRTLMDSRADPTRTEEWAGDLHTWVLR
jgi:flavin reductase (DIM6/NTAB) family NADH-FMN oxidoreductase RutF